MTDKTNMYQKGKIYTIRSDQCEKYYIGSTCNDLYKRLDQHKRDYKNYQDGKMNFITSFDVIKYDDCYIELLENYSCNSKNELNKREGEIIRLNKNNIVNKNIAGRTKKEYNNDNKASIVEYQKQYKNDNKASIVEYKKQYNKDNKASIVEYNKQYYIKNKVKTQCECGCEILSRYLIKHKSSKKHINLLSKKLSTSI